MFGQPIAGLAAEREADGAVSFGQPGGGAGVRVEQTGESFAEDGLGAVCLGTAEATDDQAQGKGAPVARDTARNESPWARTSRT